MTIFEQALWKLNLQKKKKVQIEEENSVYRTRDMLFG